MLKILGPLPYCIYAEYLHRKDWHIMWYQIRVFTTNSAAPCKASCRKVFSTYLNGKALSLNSLQYLYWSRPVCSDTIGIKHDYSCINIRQVPWEVLKTEAEDCGFQHLQRDLANVNALKNHVRSLLLHKN